MAERLGVYTALDYCDIMEHLIERWNVRNVTGLSPEGLKAQDTVCSLSERFRKLAERVERRKKRDKPTFAKFSWIFNQSILLHGEKSS